MRISSEMPDPGKNENYLKWAARARQQADDATTETARTIHLDIAREYEAKAGATSDVRAVNTDASTTE